MSPDTAIAVSHRATQLEDALRKVIRGKDDVVRLALVSVLARGHLLIEGVPGVGKTTLGQALARAIDCGFQRVQFTSDMLPADVLGISIYSAIEQKFEFKRGPIFTNVLLADEINRTTPKNSVRVTRGHERRPGHGGFTFLFSAAAFSGDCYSKSGRAPGNLSFARVAAGSVSDAGTHGISRCRF